MQELIHSKPEMKETKVSANYIRVHAFFSKPTFDQLLEAQGKVSSESSLAVRAM